MDDTATTTPGSERVTVRPITAAETRPMRAEILRPGFPAEDLAFAGDDDERTLHVGAFVGDRLVGITSVYEDARPESPPGTRGEWRLRGVATAADARRMGIGSALAERCLEHVLAHGGTLLWCNARTPAIPFYEAHGFKRVGHEFDPGGVGPHYVMQRRLD